MQKNKGLVCRKPPFQLIGYETLCPKNWVFFEDSCYKLEDRNATYEKAEQFCRYQNAKVAYPNNYNDLAFLLSSGAVSGTWMGLNDKHVDGVWTTSDETTYEGYSAIPSTHYNEL